MSKKVIKIKVIDLLVIVILGIAIGIFCTRSNWFKGVFIKKGLVIKSLTNASYNVENDEIIAELKTYKMINNKKTWCIATEKEYKPSVNDKWQLIEKNECNIKIDNKDKYIYIRDEKEVGDRILIEDYLSEVINIKTIEDIKLIVNETKEIDATVNKVGNPKIELTYTSEDENIASISENKITGISDGNTIIWVSDQYGNKESINVQVTSLLTLPVINNTKPYISNKQYTQEEAKILDDYLFYQIDEAGYKTRAGVVAAARFLSLEFQYRIPYFVENGRITHFNHQRPYCDGEGRYYHRGLYLSEDKFADIEKSVAGPAMWGAYIREWSEDNGIIRNGLDCSGFVCWCLINGGFDFGDIGGGLSEGGIPTLSDRGISQRITMELLESGTVKAGDLIGYDGHIGIIIGVEDGYIYTADTLFHSKGLVATKFSYEELIHSYFTHIYDYTNEYVEEGNYTNMW